MHRSLAVRKACGMSRGEKRVHCAPLHAPYESHGEHRISGRSIAEFQAQTVENSTFGDANGAGAHREFLGHILRPLTVDNHAPKRAPGSFLKVRLNEVQRLAEKLLTMLRLVGRVVRHQDVGNLRPPRPSFASARCRRLPLFGAEIVEDFVRCDGAQSAAKGVRRPIISKAV